MTRPLPPARSGRLRALLAVQWVPIGALIVASFSLDALGHSGVRWAADAVALVVCLAARPTDEGDS